MRFSTVVVALAASLVSASVLTERQNGLPNCALPCFTSASTGSCSASDNTCLCKNDDYLRSTTACIQKNCSAGDLATTQQMAVALCKAAGVDITTNPAAQPSSTGAASGATATSAGASASSAVASATSAAAASATATKNAAIGNVVGKGAMVGGFVAAAAVLAL